MVHSPVLNPDLPSDEQSDAIPGDCQVVSPPPKPLTSDRNLSTIEAYQTANAANVANGGKKTLGEDEDEDDDDFQMEVSGGSSLLDLPHASFDCTLPSSDRPCANCYCYVCDKPAHECDSWINDHANATRGGKWEKMRRARKGLDTSSDSEISLESYESAHSNAHSNAPSTPRSPTAEGEMQEQQNELLGFAQFPPNPRQQLAPTPNQRHITINQVFTSNLLRSVSMSKSSRKSVSSPCTQGDIQSLNATKFFMKSVHIGWPFPEIMPPQRQMALHIIEGLRNKRHVILESPTGTGKSVAILSACLAWQREEKGKNPDDAIKRIIYTSRTHSQVKQMVKTLKTMSYRPRMALLASREQYCINEELNPSDKGSKVTKGNVDSGCRQRVKNEERMRKNSLKKGDYEDNNPPYRSSDSLVVIGSNKKDQLDQDICMRVDGDDEHIENDSGEDNDQDNDADGNKVDKKCSCPHYRNLTSLRVANAACQVFRPTRPADVVDSGDAGGGICSKMGVADIEDLVEFGRDIDVKRDVAIYRKNKTKIKVKVDVDRTKGTSDNKDRDKDYDSDGVEKNFGMTVAENLDSPFSRLTVTGIDDNGAVYREGSINVGDSILDVNGVAVENLDDFREACSATPLTEPLLLNAKRPRHNASNIDSACPYYISQALSKQASTELIFAPYNYVLDPNIRKAMGIEDDSGERLPNTVIVLDEAHNVEDVLRDSGSINLNEIVLGNMMIFLQNLLGMNQRIPLDSDEMDFSLYLSSFKRKEGKDGETAEIRHVAHFLLLFLQKLMDQVMLYKKNFEENNICGKNSMNKSNEGAKRILDDKWKTNDKEEFECYYAGPTRGGNTHVVNEKCVPKGCSDFFKEIKLSKNAENKFERDWMVVLKKSTNAFVNWSKTFLKDNEAGLKMIDNIEKLIVKYCDAFSSSEHYFISITCQANGGLEYARGVPESDCNFSRGATAPVALPRSRKDPCSICMLAQFKQGGGIFDGNAEHHQNILHGKNLNGSKPKWVASINLNLLTPQILFAPLKEQCHSVILASGTLSPIGSLAAELGLTSNNSDSPSVSSPRASMPLSASIPLSASTPTTSRSSLPDDLSQQNGTPFSRNKNENLPYSTPSTPVTKANDNVEPHGSRCRLQSKPPPLQAKHVINMDKQLLAVSVGHFLDGDACKVTTANLKRDGYYEKLGNAVVSLCSAIPFGGILVFFPSKATLKQCVYKWKRENYNYGESIWRKLENPETLDLQRQIIVEPNGGQAEFEMAKLDYVKAVDSGAGAILLAVFRGKMSEGVSFNNDYARGVICIGHPLPNFADAGVNAKKNYNDEQRKFNNRTDLLPGDEWYNQQAYRAMSQALGRCIRHKNDFGAIFLLDARHCEADGEPRLDNAVARNHKNFPKWMNFHIKNLVKTKSREGVVGRVVGGEGGDENRIFGSWYGLHKVCREFFTEAQSFVDWKSGEARVGERVEKNNGVRQKRRLELDEGVISNGYQQLSAGNISSSDFSNSSNTNTNTNTNTNSSIAQAFNPYSSETNTNNSLKKSPPPILSAFENIMPSIKGVNDPKSGANAANAFKSASKRAKKKGPGTLTNFFGTKEAPVELSSEDDATSDRAPRLSFPLPPPVPQAPPPLRPPPVLPPSGGNSVPTTEETDDVDDECSICLTNKKNVVILPCAHLCLCEECAGKEVINECPLCGKEVASKMKIFR